MTISREKSSKLISTNSDVVINNCNNSNNNNNNSCPLENGERNNQINGEKVSPKALRPTSFLGNLHEHVMMF